MEKEELRKPILKHRERRNRNTCYQIIGGILLVVYALSIFWISAHAIYHEWMGVALWAGIAVDVTVFMIPFILYIHFHYKKLIKQEEDEYYRSLALYHKEVEILLDEGIEIEKQEHKIIGHIEYIDPDK